MNSNGGSVTDLSNDSSQDGSPAWQKAAVVDISAGQPVPEPATGSVPATFTVTLPKAQASDVTIHYKTLDGTAKAAANAYTAIADGSVMIPGGPDERARPGAGRQRVRAGDHGHGELPGGTDERVGSLPSAAPRPPA